MALTHGYLSKRSLDIFQTQMSILQNHSLFFNALTFAAA
jgi:hypothetical protein